MQRGISENTVNELDSQVSIRKKKVNETERTLNSPVLLRLY